MNLPLTRARRLERGDLFAAELKADELHGRGLALRAGILPGRIGLATDPRGASIAFYLDEGTVFDPAKPRAAFGALTAVSMPNLHSHFARFASVFEVLSPDPAFLCRVKSLPAAVIHDEDAVDLDLAGRANRQSRRR